MAPQRKKPSDPFAWYNKLAAFQVASLFSRKRLPGPARSVVVHQDIPPDYKTDKGKVKKEHVYPTNQVITSKYTIITFLPRNLLEQFRRVANIFFAVIAILQFFSLFSTISPGLVILPLLLVLGITACKDGYEDIKRHQSDRRVNSTIVRVLEGGDFVNHNVTGKKSKTFVRGLVPRSLRKKPQAIKSGDLEMQQNAAPPEAITNQATPEETYDDSYEYDYLPDGFDDHSENRRHSFFRRRHHERHPRWRKGRWEDVKVGDFVKIYDNEPIPADIVICATSEEENVAFVETKNLDGETNLKSRNACPVLTHLRDAKACADPNNPFHVNCERPDHSMYRLAAAVATPNGTYPIDLGQTLLRGTVLRHTGWVIGLVIYTGEDTKIVLNSGGTPSKRSRVERQMNPQVFINLLLLAAMAVVCGVTESSLEKYYSPLGAPWLYGDSISDDNPRINGLTTLVFALITFQNIVPISLYISIEFVRTAQAAFIYFDKNIWYEKTGQATIARSWNLSDDLGQIEYIFSDKTGTLTQNVMVFRKCSIGGKAYHGSPPVEETPKPEVEPEKTEARVNSTSTDARQEVRSSDSTSTAVQDQQTGNRSNPSLLQAERPKPNPETQFYDPELFHDIESAVNAEPGQENLARSLNGFFTVLSLCHTVLTTVHPETGTLQYKAQSPDEEALVEAAASAGYVFRGRQRDVLHLQTPFSDELERYQLVNILEFTSTRKRMSVIVKKLDDGDDRLFLLTKGADNVIYERLKSGGDVLKQVTEEHLDMFANEGLRTLTLAYKVISQDEYDTWSVRYNEAIVALEDREEKIAAASAEIEYDLRLLGATAIEDRLQDGVPEAIADLKTAGIKIWVATGDKLETAIAIGHSTNLISKDSNMIIVRGDGSRPIWAQMVNAMQEFFPDEAESQGITLDMDKQDPPPSDDTYPLRRVNTGVTSIVGSDNGERPGGFVLIIDGLALTDAFSDDAHKNLLLTLATHCEGVVCCRVSPLQKALVVRLVKDGLGAMTLAIGDGANDVSMIQAAHVGVGISGEEGLQAVNSSDYAIAQFRFLKRLLLVHGHWSYARNGNMIVNFFYKNIVCIGVLWWFQIYCGWSSQYVFEYTFLLWWNSFWTIAPTIAIGLFDRIVDDDVLMALPELYRYGREGHWFSMKLFIAYMLDGIMQSAIIYFIILYGYFVPTSRPDGYDVNQYEFSTVMVISAVFVANCFNGLQTNVWTGWVFFAVALGNVLILLYTAIYSSISPGWFNSPVYGNNHFLWSSAYFWFSIILTFFLALAPRYVYKSYNFIFNPNDLEILRWAKKVDPHRDFAREAHTGGQLSRLKPSTRSGVSSVMGSAAPSRSTFDGERPGAPQLRTASRTDMSTGLRSTHRGFGFAVEEGGPAIRRLQSNLSAPRPSQTSLSHGLGATAKQKMSFASLRNPLKKRRPRTTSTEGHDRH